MPHKDVLGLKKKKKKKKNALQRCACQNIFQKRQLLVAHDTLGLTHTELTSSFIFQLASRGFQDTQLASSNIELASSSRYRTWLLATSWRSYIYLYISYNTQFACFLEHCPLNVLSNQLVTSSKKVEDVLSTPGLVEHPTTICSRTWLSHIWWRLSTVMTPQVLPTGFAEQKFIKAWARKQWPLVSSAYQNLSVSSYTHLHVSLPHGIF